jgi:hypothetical protein
MTNCPHPTAAAATSTSQAAALAAARAAATLAQPASTSDPLLRDWLAPHADALFGWTMACALNADHRRAIADVAVTVQRLRGRAGLLTWLFNAALHAAPLQAHSGGLPPHALADLPPELRGLLRLLAADLLRHDEAMALLVLPLSRLRQRLDAAQWQARYISKTN